MKQVNGYGSSAEFLSDSAADYENKVGKGILSAVGSHDMDMGPRQPDDGGSVETTFAEDPGDAAAHYAGVKMLIDYSVE